MVNALSLLSSLLLLSASVSAASQHGAGRIGRRAHSRAVSRAEDPLIARRNVLEQRSTAARQKRCKARSSSSAAAAASTSIHVTTSSPAAVKTTSKAAPTTVAIGNVEQPKVTTTKAAEAVPTTSKAAAVVHTTTTKKATPVVQTTHAAQTTAAASSGGGNSLLTGTKSGQGTFYSAGDNSCGGHDSDSDAIVAISHILYDAYPGATDNPNDNPVCGKYITASRNGKSVTVKVTDKCMGCDEWNIDFSPSAFTKLATEDEGRVDLTWVWA